MMLDLALIQVSIQLIHQKDEVGYELSHSRPLIPFLYG